MVFSMKKMRTAFIVLLTSFLVSQLFFWYSEKNNLMILLQNNADQNVSVVLSVDGDTLFDGEVGYNDRIPKELKLTRYLGRHTLKIIRKDNGAVFEKRFTLIVVKWLVINFNTNNEIVDQHYHRRPFFQ